MTKRIKFILTTLLIVVLIGTTILIVSQTNKKSNRIIQRHNNETKKILKESLEWKNLSFYRRSTNVAKKCNNKVISKSLEELKTIINKIDRKAFIVINETKYIQNGFIKR